MDDKAALPDDASWFLVSSALVASLYTISMTIIVRLGGGWKLEKLVERSEYLLNMNHIIDSQQLLRDLGRGIQQ
jgi:hypothetical protein